MKTDSKPGALAGIVCIGLLVLGAGKAAAQVAIDVPGVSVKVNKGNTAVGIGPGSHAGNVSGAIDSGADIEGITIINDELSIDGEKVPRGTKNYTSRKTGKSYRIKWGKNGNISVEQN